MKHFVNRDPGVSEFQGTLIEASVGVRRRGSRLVNRQPRPEAAFDQVAFDSHNRTTHSRKRNTAWDPGFRAWVADPKFPAKPGARSLVSGNASFTHCYPVGIQSCVALQPGAPSNL